MEVFGTIHNPFLRDQQVEVFRKTWFSTPVSATLRNITELMRVPIMRGRSLL
jgi:hypothetical protein